MYIQVQSCFARSFFSRRELITSARCASFSAVSTPFAFLLLDTVFFRVDRLGAGSAGLDVEALGSFAGTESTAVVSDLSGGCSAFSCPVL